MLLKETELQGKAEGKFLLWTVPRIEALPAYISYGFVKASDFFKGKWETNCYAIKVIK